MIKKDKYGKNLKHLFNIFYFIYFFFECTSKCVCLNGKSKYPDNDVHFVSKCHNTHTIPPPPTSPTHTHIYVNSD